MKVPVYDKATGTKIVLRDYAEPFPFCECCGWDERYMLICDHLVLCRDCARNWKRLGLKKFLETYWLPFDMPYDMPVMEKRCKVNES